MISYINGKGENERPKKSNQQNGVGHIVHSSVNVQFLWYKIAFMNSSADLLNQSYHLLMNDEGPGDASPYLHPSFEGLQ